MAQDLSIQTLIKDRLETAEDYKFPYGFKIKVQSISEAGWADFVGTFKGMELCSGTFNCNNSWFVDYNLVGDDGGDYENIFRTACRIIGIDSKRISQKYAYPEVPGTFDGNSLREYFHQVVSAFLRVPVQSRLVLVEPNFRFQPTEESLKIHAPRYRIEVLFFGNLIFSIDVAKGSKTTFIQNAYRTNTAFVPVDAKVLYQIRSLLIKTKMTAFEGIERNYGAKPGNIFTLAERVKVFVDNGTLKIEP